MHSATFSTTSAERDLKQNRGKKKREFDARVNIMKYKAPWNAPKENQEKWALAVEQTWVKVREFPMGGKPLRDFIHANVKNLTKLRSDLFAWVPEEL